MADDDRQAHIGVAFSRQYQKQGYATEALKGLLDYLFGELHLHRVTAVCDDENLASARLMERVEMRREGNYMDNCIPTGRGAQTHLCLLDPICVEN